MSSFHLKKKKTNLQRKYVLSEAKKNTCRTKSFEMPNTINILIFLYKYYCEYVESKILSMCWTIKFHFHSSNHLQWTSSSCEKTWKFASETLWLMSSASMMTRRKSLIGIQLATQWQIVASEIQTWRILVTNRCSMKINRYIHGQIV